MAKTIENTTKSFYCDKFDPAMVSSLSLFLFKHTYTLLAKDMNGHVAAIHQFYFNTNRELIQLLEADSLYKIDVSTKAFVHESTFSLVPGLLFDPAHINAFLYFSEETDPDAIITNHKLENNIHLLGAIPPELASLLGKNKPQIEFVHGAASFLSYALKEKPNLIDQEIMVVLSDSFFYLAAFATLELTVFNRFELTDREDLLKYIFGITHQLGFDRMHCRITLFGETEEYNIDENYGKEYFRNFRIINPQFNQHYLQGTENFSNKSLFESFWEFN